MKSLFFIILVLASAPSMFSQTMKVAILDFENTSENTEFDGLGKVLSSMLITDLSQSINSDDIEFYERSQLNKLLEEQNLQKGKNFDSSTAVSFGKLSGVNLVFVGVVFELNGTFNFSSKLVDVESAKILLSKSVSGPVDNWLKLKTELAEAIALQLNTPIAHNVKKESSSSSLAAIKQYGNILNSMDQGDLELAERMRSDLQETMPDFEYFLYIKDEIEGFNENKKLYAYSKLAKSLLEKGDYGKALENSRKAQEIYKYYPEANEVELLALINLRNNAGAEEKYFFIVDSLILMNERKFSRINGNKLLIWESSDGVDFHLSAFYSGLSANGYGAPVKNEIQLKKMLINYKLSISFTCGRENTYKRIEKTLLSSKDTTLFSSEHMLDFYRLSLVESFLSSKDDCCSTYGAWLRKEISRMESFGLSCISCSDGKRVPLGPNSDNMQQNKWEQANVYFGKLGLSISMAEFNSDFQIVYGQFILNYLAYLVHEKKRSEAYNLYQKFLQGYVVDRDSYFYGDYWDVVLGCRIVNDDLTSKRPLSKIDFASMLREKLEMTQEMLGFRADNSFLYDSTVSQIEDIDVSFFLDEKCAEGSLYWTTNLSISSDYKGNDFTMALFDTFQDLYTDSVPAYCYYDFDDSNGEKHGKLYNYWALKLITENPPNGWRVANQSDFADLLGLTDLVEGGGYNDINSLLENVRFEGIFDVLTPSGQFFGNGFCCIEDQAWFWTGEASDIDGRHRVVDIYEDGQVRFSDYSCEDCYFAIRLVKAK